VETSVYDVFCVSVAGAAPAKATGGRDAVLRVVLTRLAAERHDLDLAACSVTRDDDFGA